jgi:hypothetical protein
MRGGKSPATEDRERLERYLRWRRSAAKRRAARRKRLSRYITATGLAVIGLALVTWRLERARDERTPIGSVRPLPSQSATESHNQMRVPLRPGTTAVGETSADPVPRTAVGRIPRSEPRERAAGANTERPRRRQRLAPSSPVLGDPAPVPDIAVGLRVPGSSQRSDPDVARLPSTPTAALAPSVADSSESIASATSTKPKPDDTQMIAPPRESAAITPGVTPPNVPDAGPKEGYGGASVAQQPGAAAHRGPTRRAPADSVRVWLKSEVQEFRDGVEHEVREFRAGIERLRRTLERFSWGGRED